MPNETTYVFFNLLLCGLLTAEIFYRAERSQRTGLTLGLIVVGLFTALTFEHSKTTLKREWLSIGLVLAVIISLTCTGELVWGEVDFKIIMMIILLVAGALNVWVEGGISHLPPLFWLLVSLGAVIATFALGQKFVDLGAWLGAWIWVIFGFVFDRIPYTNT